MYPEAAKISLGLSHDMLDFRAALTK